jgi:hypothetical protein
LHEALSDFGTAGPATAAMLGRGPGEITSSIKAVVVGVVVVAGAGSAGSAAGVDTSTVEGDPLSDGRDASVPDSRLDSPSWLSNGSGRLVSLPAP